MASALAPACAVLLLAVGCGLGACERGGGTAAPQVARPSKKVAPAADPGIDPAVDAANRTMVGGVPVGTSSAPVDVRFMLPAAPAPGVPFTIEVAVLPQAPAPVLRIEVRPGEGLVVADPTGPVVLEKIQAGTVQRLSIKASSAGSGTRVIGVAVTVELPGGAEGREYDFPIVIAAAGAAAAAGR